MPYVYIVGARRYESGGLRQAIVETCIVGQPFIFVSQRTSSKTTSYSHEAIGSAGELFKGKMFLALPCVYM